MRMVFADHVADDARAFLVALDCRIEPQQPHRPEQAGDAPASARREQVGQRARGDRRQRIDEVTLADSALSNGASTIVSNGSWKSVGI